MTKRCIVKGCPNSDDQGKFVGDLCFPCHEHITIGESCHSQAYQNARETALSRFSRDGDPGPVVDRNRLYVLIEDLISAGFRGSREVVIDIAVKKYYRQEEPRPGFVDSVQAPTLQTVNALIKHVEGLSGSFPKINAKDLLATLRILKKQLGE